MTLAAALVATVDGVVAASRGELPANIALVAFPLAILGFVGTGAVIALLAWRTLALPRAVAGGWALAIALTLLAPVAMVTAGAVPVLLLVAVQAAWGLALIQLGRAVPPRNEAANVDALI